MYAYSYLFVSFCERFSPPSLSCLCIAFIVFWRSLLCFFFTIFSPVLFVHLHSLLFVWQQLQHNVNNLAAKPQQTDWLARMSHNAMRTEVLSLNSVGDRPATVGVWTNMAKKYLALKSEGNQTAARKVTNLRGFRYVLKMPK